MFESSIRNIKFSLLILAALACSKKAEDSPQPAPTPANPSAQATREVPVSIASNQTAAAGDGTVRTAPTFINVDGVSVAVQAPDDQFRTSMSSSGGSSLNEILGANSSQLRSEASNDIGWEIKGVRVNGALDDTSSLYNDWYLFNANKPGIYYVFRGGPKSGGPSLLKNWSWGTYAVDKDLNFIAFDLDGNNIPAQVWSIQYLNKGLMSLKSKVKINGRITAISLKLDAGDFSENKALNGLIKPNKFDMQLAMPNGSTKSGWKLIGEETSGMLDSSKCVPPTIEFSLGYLLAGNGFLPCNQVISTSGNKFYMADSLDGTKKIRFYNETLNFNGQVYNDAVINGNYVFQNGKLKITYTTFPVFGYTDRTFVFVPVK